MRSREGLKSGGQGGTAMANVPAMPPLQQIPASGSLLQQQWGPPPLFPPGMPGMSQLAMGVPSAPPYGIPPAMTLPRWWQQAPPPYGMPSPLTSPQGWTHYAAQRVQQSSEAAPAGQEQPAPATPESAQAEEKEEAEPVDGHFAQNLGQCLDMVEKMKAEGVPGGGHLFDTSMLRMLKVEAARHEEEVAPPGTPSAVIFATMSRH